MKKFFMSSRLSGINPWQESQDNQDNQEPRTILLVTVNPTPTTSTGGMRPYPRARSCGFLDAAVEVTSESST